MTAPGKAEPSEKVPQKIFWDPEDWGRVTRIAERLTADTQIDVNPTDAVRVSVRRLHETLFGLDQAAP